MCSIFGGPPKFEIQFDSPSKAYFSGTSMTGKILLKLDKPKKVRGLRVEFSGKAKVSWREHRNSTVNGKTNQNYVTYSAEELYMKSSYYVLGSADGDIVIPTGEHVYPFSTCLAHNLPSSFNGEHGKIEYIVTATLERSWKFDLEATSLFSVVTPVDLNEIPHAKTPVMKVESKSFGWFTRSGLLTLNVRMPYSGFVPGQSLEVTIEADNGSDVNVESVDCKIREDAEFISRGGRTKKTSTDLVKISSQGVQESESRVWMLSILTPQMPHVNLATCSIINVRHNLVVVAKVGMMHRNLQVEIPLILGTVPIMDLNDTMSRPPPYFEGFTEEKDEFLPLGFVVKS